MKAVFGPDHPVPEHRLVGVAGHEQHAQAGNSAPSRSASTRPLISGITTSVTSRSTPPGCSAHSRAACVAVRRRRAPRSRSRRASAAPARARSSSSSTTTIVSLPRSAPRLGGAAARRRPVRSAARQVDLERGAAALLAVDEDRAAALLDDAEHGREPEPGARRRGLGGEERLEQAAGGPRRSCRSPVSLTASITCGAGRAPRRAWRRSSSSSVDVARSRSSAARRAASRRARWPRG